MFLIDRRYFRYFDWISFFLIIILSSLGLLLVYSATYKPELPYSLYFKKQALGLVSAWLLYFICCTVDFRSTMRWGYFLYFLVILLLIFTIIKGTFGKGAQRWINLGLFKPQPSELPKLLFPAFAAYYFFAGKEANPHALKDFLPVLCVLGISVLLILKQPDLGTALILFFSGLIMLWLAGLPKKFFILGLLFFILSAPLTWHFLKDYQKQRIAVYFGYGDLQKERYQIEQAKIAIGSGGMYGKGFLKGTQNKLLFLPESRTDFIFAVVGEEFGFVGALIIVLLYLLLFFRLFFIIKTFTSPFIQLLAIGLTTHVVLSACFNISMVLGLLPVVGIPLPLLSYGLSNLWITFISLGWINSISMRRFNT